MLNTPTLKQARAALFLVPILGLNYLLLPFRPAECSGLTEVYDVLSSTIGPFQGVAVAVLLCFTNSEVVALLKTRFHQYTENHGINTNFTRLHHTLANSGSDKSEAKQEQL